MTDAKSFPFLGAEPVPAQIFEQIVEHLEETCWENIHKLLKSEETLSLEFDEDVICDVCRSVSIKFGVNAKNYTNSDIISNSLIGKRVMRWCFVTFVTFACIRPVME